MRLRNVEKTSIHCWGECFTIHSSFFRAACCLDMYLFIYGLYKHSELGWRPVVSNDRNVVNNELERMWKETALAYFKVDCVWNVMAHAQKPDFVLRRNGRVHLKRRGRQFSRLLAAEVCTSALVMLDTPRCELVWKYWLPTPFASFPFTSPPMRHRVPSGFKHTLLPRLCLEELNKTAKTLRWIGVPVESLTEYLPNTRSKRYRLVQLFGVWSSSSTEVSFNRHIRRVKCRNSSVLN